MSRRGTEESFCYLPCQWEQVSETCSLPVEDVFADVETIQLLRDVPSRTVLEDIDDVWMHELHIDAAREDFVVQFGCGRSIFNIRS